MPCTLCICNAKNACHKSCCLDQSGTSTQNAQAVHTGVQTCSCQRTCSAIVWHSISMRHDVFSLSSALKSKDEARSIDLKQIVKLASLQCCWCYNATFAASFCNMTVMATSEWCHVSRMHATSRARNKKAVERYLNRWYTSMPWIASRVFVVLNCTQYCCSDLQMSTVILIFIHA